MMDGGPCVYSSRGSFRGSDSANRVSRVRVRLPYSARVYPIPRARVYHIARACAYHISSARARRSRRSDRARQARRSRWSRQARWARRSDRARQARRSPSLYSSAGRRKNRKKCLTSFRLHEIKEASQALNRNTGEQP